MEQRYEIAMLLDFYGQLLTKKQYEIMDLYYNHDFSLAEISKSFAISRQGVHDSIRKGKVTLNRYEEKLMLVQRFFKQKQVAQDILSIICEMEEQQWGVTEKKTMQCIKNKLQSILDE